MGREGGVNGLVNSTDTWETTWWSNQLWRSIVATMPSNNSRLTRTQARAKARSKTLETVQQRREAEEAKLKLRLAEEEKALKANEPDIAEFLKADSDTDEAEAQWLATKDRCARRKAVALRAIAERTGSVSAAAKLVGVSASKARALLALDDEPATTAAQNQSESADAASEVDSTDVENQPPSTGSPSSDESESVGADAQPEPALSH